MHFNERSYRAKVRPHLLRCRPGDWLHAQKAARWVKKLGKDRRDLPLLLTASYIHDLGWRDIFHTRRPIALRQLLKHEQEANRNSKPYITAFLQDLRYTTPQIRKVLRLIRAADRHRSQRPDEAIIVDADQLCKLSLRHLKTKFQRSDWPEILPIVEQMLSTALTTKCGKAYAAPLLARFRKQTT